MRAFHRKLKLTILTALIAVPCACLAQERRSSSKTAPPLKKDLAIDLGDSVKMQFVLVRSGSFTMGSDSGDSTDDEQPIHTVKISKPFYLGKFEVTQEEWQTVMGNNPSQFKGARRPVETVSWSDCQEFLKKLASKSRKLTFLLPTEAEWEYACRAGSKTEYSFGNETKRLREYAWYEGNSESKTHDVGTKKPNRWKLYDMHGNVAEWCADWYGPYKSATQANPIERLVGSNRVVRGSSWFWYDQVLRSSSRDMLKPVSAIHGVGFRVLGRP
jgi:formylglycine-generating enzyme required for sulfatase activity